MRPCGTGTPTHWENRRGEGRPPSGGRKGPSADPGVGAAVARVAGAADAGNPLAKGSSWSSRDLACSPLSFASLRSSRVGEGDEARVSSPLGPSSCALVGVSAVGTLSELFQARLSCARTGPGEGGGGPGAGSACNPAGKGLWLVIQNAKDLAQVGNARARQPAQIEQFPGRRGLRTADPS